MTKRRTVYYRKKWTCSSCGNGPFLAPLNLHGRLAPGFSSCPSCGHVYDPKDDKVEVGPKITDEDAILGIHAGKHDLCPYCQTRNPAIEKVDGMVRDVVRCKSCGAMFPDHDRASALDHLSGGVRDRAEATAPDVGLSDNAVQTWMRDTRPAPAYTPSFTPAPKPKKRRFDIRTILFGLGGLLIVGALIWLVVWSLTPRNETLRVTGFTVERCSGYSWTQHEPEEGWADEAPARRTPVSSEIRNYQPSGEVIVATVVSTEVSVKQVESCDDSNSNVYVPCPGVPTQDTEAGAVAVEECQATPVCVLVDATEVSTTTSNVYGTPTPYDREWVEYIHDVAKNSSVCTGVQQTHTIMPWPSIPESVSYSNGLGNLTAYTSLTSQSGTYTVLFINGKEQERTLVFHENDLDPAFWESLSRGQVFEDAQVLPNGTIQSLYPDPEN